MTEPKQRKDMNPEFMWDFSHIYATKEDWEAALVEAEKAIEVAASYKGKLTASAEALADGLDAAGVEVDDLIGVAGRGIDLPECDVVVARGSRFLEQLTLAVFERRAALFELARRQLEHHLGIGVAELADKQEVGVVVDRRDANAARMADDFAQCVGAILESDLVVCDVEYFSVEDFLAAKCFFCQVHGDLRIGYCADERRTRGCAFGWIRVILLRR